MSFLARLASRAAGANLGSRLKIGASSAAKWAWHASGGSSIPLANKIVDKIVEIHKSRQESRFQREQATNPLTSAREQHERENRERQERAHERALAASKKQEVQKPDPTLVQMAEDVHDIKKLMLDQKKEGGGLFDKLKDVLASGLGALTTGLLALPGLRRAGGLLRGAWRLGGRAVSGLLNVGRGALNIIRGGAAAATAGTLIPTVASKARSIGSGILGFGRAAIGRVGDFLRSGANLAGNAVRGAGAMVGRGVQVAAPVIQAAAGAVRNVGSSIARNIGTGLGRAAIKKIPLVGALAGLYFGAKRALGGDWTGAGLEISSGLASTVPGVGTAASVASDAALAAHDMRREAEADPTPDGITEPTPSFKKVSSDSPRIDAPEVPRRTPDGQRTLTILARMLELMSDENAGIYTRPARQTFGSNLPLNALPAITVMPARPTTPAPVRAVHRTDAAPGTVRAPEIATNNPALPARLIAPSATRLDPVAQGSFISANQILMSQTQEAIDRGVRYGFGSKDIASGAIDCSGWVAAINKGLLNEINRAGEEMAGSRQARRLFDAPAAGIVENIANVTGEMLTNEQLTLDTLREGMIIGEDNGDKGWDRGRFQGIDHVTQVVRDPLTGELMISQSSSGKGVSLEPAQRYLERKKARGARLFGVDTEAALNKVTGGQFAARTGDLMRETPQLASELVRSRNEAEAQSVAQLPPIIVQAPVQQQGVPSGIGRGLEAPLQTRNTDSAIRRLTDNHIYAASPYA